MMMSDSNEAAAAAAAASASSADGIQPCGDIESGDVAPDVEAQPGTSDHSIDATKFPGSTAGSPDVETEPTMKGNTASSHTKPAVLSCGATITIPGFIEQGTKIKVDTEKGIYLERV